ncbi:hypothetical protein L596_013369 [Steinernema carpocapsae]|uniref:Proteasomal ubiquitin receptor ADRM1 homolog n=1 Tax=Steinernema carpocapsae TaxID=34508 RepID=A0A4U5P0T0_STECR|nr:hypothetical protein L596_013369 [Steinernema carpocapsae]
MALFAPKQGAPTSDGGSGHLVEFKAGRAFLEPGSTPDSRKVVSDKTKGMVFIKQTSDQLIHFCWKNRETNAVVDDLIIFPEDTKFLKVKECTDGRVFMLKFENNDRRLFWMQDSRTDKDEEILKKVNDVLNRPPSGRQGGRGGNTERSGGLGATLNALGNGNDAMGNNDNQSQLMQLLHLMNSNGSGSASANALISSLLGGSDSTPTTTSSPTPTTASSSTRRRQSAGNGGQLKLSDLQAILNSIDSKGERSSDAGPSTDPRGPLVELTDVLKASNLAETVMENEERLLPHLPNSEPVKADTEELKITLTSPQFRQATDMFGSALQTGQMGMVLKQFGCSDRVGDAAATGDLMKFAKTLTDEQKENTTDESADVEVALAEINAEINREAEAEETTEASVKEPEAKKPKLAKDDDMELD